MVSLASKVIEKTLFFSPIAPDVLANSSTIKHKIGFIYISGEGLKLMLLL